MTAVQERSADRNGSAHWAELVGTDTNSKRAIRWLLALRLVVLTCDPLGHGRDGHDGASVAVEMPQVAKPPRPARLRQRGL
jgi:hypothetical protein